MVASGYAAQHSDAVDGVVLLAAYPTEKISDSVGLLSVYGTDDKVLDRGAYESAKRYFPDGYTEKIISVCRSGRLVEFRDWVCFPLR